MNDVNMIIAIINFISFIAACLIMSYVYILSIQPVKRAEKRREKAWKECKTYRSIGGLFEFVAVINMVIWIWFPLQHDESRRDHAKDGFS